MRARLALIGWLATGAAPLPAADALPPAPHLVCDQPIFDFGQRDNRDEFDHVYVLKNEGQTPLVIDRVRTGCGCTKAELGANTVPPGGQTTLTLGVALKGRSGSQRFSTFIHSNDPDQSYFILRCVGAAIAEVEITPSVLNFEATAGEPPPAEQAATLINRSDIPLRITSLVVSGAFFTVSVETNETGRAQRLIVRSQTNNVKSSANGHVLLMTDHPRHPNALLPVFLRIVGELTVVPRELLFIEKPPTAEPEVRHMIIRSARQTPFKVQAIDSPDPALKAAVHTSGPGWYDIQVGPLVPTEALNGATIRIRTDLKGGESVDVPIRTLPAPPPPPAAGAPSKPAGTP